MTESRFASYLALLAVIALGGVIGEAVGGAVARWLRGER